MLDCFVFKDFHKKFLAEAEMIKSYIRKIIFVDDSFMRGLQADSVTDYQQFESPGIDTQVINLNHVHEDEIAELTDFIDVEDMHVGSILFKPPYVHRFLSGDTVVEDLVIRKYALLTQLAVALGAKRVNILNFEEVEVEASDSHSSGGSAQVNSPVVSAELDAETGVSAAANDIRKAAMSFNVEATGGEVDLMAAAAIINEYGLKHDIFFMSLYEMRSLKSNDVKSHKICMDYSGDIKKMFDSSIKAKLEVMGRFCGGMASYQKTASSLEKSRRATRLTVEVSF